MKGDFQLILLLFFINLLNKQKPLDYECAKILNDNLWDLYDRDD